jgi:hypothetical protein
MFPEALGKRQARLQIFSTRYSLPQTPGDRLEIQICKISVFSPPYSKNSDFDPPDSKNLCFSM